MFCDLHNVWNINYYCLNKMFIPFLGFIRISLFYIFNDTFSNSSQGTVIPMWWAPVNIIPWVCLLSAQPSLYKAQMCWKREVSSSKAFHNEKTSSIFLFSNTLSVWDFRSNHQCTKDVPKKNEFTRIFWKQL